MRSQLIIMMDEAIANYDKAIARQKTLEWEEYADEFDMSMWYLEEMLESVVDNADKIVDTLNEELYLLEEAANEPFDKFV